MTDQLATLKAAEAAGATIQAYTIYPSDKEASPYYDRDVQMPLAALPMGSGYWRDLEGPVQWSCDPSRYRIKPEGEA